MELLVTQAHLDAARRAGACDDALRRYKVGTPIWEIDRDHLVWIEAALPDLAREIVALAAQSFVRGSVPLSMLGDGYGDGGSRDIVQAGDELGQDAIGKLIPF